MNKLSAFGLGLFFAAGALSGCGGGGGGPMGDDPPATSIGQSVYSTAVQKVVAKHDGGGFRPAPPAGSTCGEGGGTYTLTVATQNLAWIKCVGDGKVAYTETTGSRTLTAAEFKDLSDSLEKLKIVSATVCGADKAKLALSVTTGGGTQDYGDSFYGCEIKDRPLVDFSQLGEVLSKFRSLAM